MIETQVLVLLKKMALAGQQLAAQGQVLAQLLDGATVDLAPVLGPVALLSEGFARAMLNTLAWTMQESDFVLLSLDTQRQVGEQATYWAMLASVFGNIIFHKRLTSIDALITATPTAQLLGANARGVAVGSQLEKLLSVPALAGVRIEAFWALSPETRISLGRLISMDLVTQPWLEFGSPRSQFVVFKDQVTGLHYEVIFSSGPANQLQLTTQGGVGGWELPGTQTLGLFDGALQVVETPVPGAVPLPTNRLVSVVGDVVQITQVTPDPESFDPFVELSFLLDHASPRVPDAAILLANIQKIQPLSFIEKVTGGVVPVTIREGATLPQIAAELLSDPDQWRMIAEFNGLREPYISDDPLAQFGAVQSQRVLAEPTSAGAMTAVLADVVGLLRDERIAFDYGLEVSTEFPAVVFIDQDTGQHWAVTFGPALTFEETTADGIPGWLTGPGEWLGIFSGVPLIVTDEIVGALPNPPNTGITTEGGALLYTPPTPVSRPQTLTIADVDLETNTVTFVEAFVVSFPVSSILIVYSPAYEVAPVLRTGDKILIPVDSVQQPSAIILEKLRPQDTAALYGTDLLVTAEGRLQIAEGDLQLVSGIPNLTQALRHRFAVDTNSLAFHPTYGTGLRRYLGRKFSPFVSFLAQIEGKQTVKKDPRIREITNFTALVQGDTLLMSFSGLTSNEEQFPIVTISAPLI